MVSFFPSVRRHGELLGVPLDEHLGFLIDALRPRAAELGLTGRS